ncbi:M14 family metallocarboxypeptidase [Cohnella sp. CFH 77786]|uniref:M14 family metallopeptidase n=1 Tax=Cohnella sp. CFH 77786 TaxID=2662265 RepID=UPI0021080FD5|nr:M14 family metallocarboxypeptidase [Cohnella sp. CFH 77786]
MSEENRNGRTELSPEEYRYGWTELSRDLQRLVLSYPFLSVCSIGCSVLGKPIYAFRIGEGPFRWHFNASCHANEWITTPLVMHFAEQYAAACCTQGTVGGKPASALYRKTSLWIVPMLNPDGVELVQTGLQPGHPFYRELLHWNGGNLRFEDWKANARGVDLNDQFPAHWEEERERRQTPGPGPRDYGGPAPLSEPEAFSLAEWTAGMDFHAVIALHTQGEEIYWNYRGHEPPESGSWAERLAEASGYRAVYLEGSDAGYKDWFLQAFGRPGFTVEAGFGRNPLPFAEFPSISERLNRLLAEALDLPE